MIIWDATYIQGERRMRGQLYIENRHLVFKSGETQLVWDEFAITAHRTADQITIESTTEGKSKIVSNGPTLATVLAREMGVTVQSIDVRWVSKNQTLAAIGIVGGAILIILLIAQLLRMQSKFLASFISQKQEIALGEVVFKSERHKIVQLDPESRQMWDGLIAQLTNQPALNGRSWQVHINRDLNPNAMALPGEHIVFTYGFIRQAESADEILGVLAHELAHTQLRHQIQHLSSSLASGFLLTFILGGPAANIANGLDTLADLKFSRKHEAEADAIGMQLLANQGISAKGLRAFFERSLSKNALGDNLAWASTHPTDASRVQKISTHIASESGTRDSLFPLEKFKAKLELSSAANQPTTAN